MKSNKMGIQVKKGDTLTRAFGITSKIAHTLFRFYEKARPTENDYSDEQTRKTLLEIEIRKSQAIGSSHKLQNC